MKNREIVLFDNTDYSERYDSQIYADLYKKIIFDTSL